MHPVVIDKPYEFVPPYRGRWWPRILQWMLPRQLKKDYGIESVECTGLEHLRQSQQMGRGIILAPNHCRPADPLVVNHVCGQAGLIPHTMASWHLFMGSRLQAFILRRAGAFSVYREGMDRQALQTAVDIVAEAQRPLVIFPEGVITRTNDRLIALMEGLSFVARSAAKKRKEQEAGVVFHPMALRYHVHGNVESELHSALDDIEHRLAWRPKRDASLLDRIYRVGEALLWLKEIEYFGSPQSGDLNDRLRKLIDGILLPIEQEWLPDKSSGGKTVVARVKELRVAILPDMIEGNINDDERARRWDQLADMYLAQQLGHYPPNYVRSNPTSERLLETVEKFEEDLTDFCRVYRPMSVSVEVGEAIEVSAKRVRGQADPVMTELDARLRQMLGIESSDNGGLLQTSSKNENSKASVQQPASAEPSVE